MNKLYRGRVQRSTFMSDFGKLFALVILAAVGFAVSVTMRAQGYAEPTTSVRQSAVLAATTTVSGAHTEPVTNLADATTAASSTTCTVNRTYVSPATLDLSTANNGLTIARDALTSYSVRGQTIEELRANLINCASRKTVAGNYHAITARNISWAYEANQDGAVCRLSNIKVGLHLAQFMPSLHTANVSSDVVAEWNTYQTNLTAHEEGHIDNAKQYAAQIFTDIENQTAPTCDGLQKQVALSINTDLTRLNNADELYDTQTNHGATQGAVL